ncbi:MAG: type I phosphomannose isomerase catalytic subunit [Planctomycetota bacterium]|jgi:mannose-6-phosphate isomerase
MSVHPLIFEPIYKPKIWGGDRIFTHFQRPPVGTKPIGESWELADLEQDQSRVVAGSLRGKTLAQLRDEMGRDLLGNAGLFEGRFPLLIKFLDAHKSLSIQVHPTEKVARRLGGNVRVKHEAWYILDADAGGFIYHGLEPGIKAESFREAMLEGKIAGVLRKINVKPGQCYYLPSGTVHALGAGVLVAEVQTPSDITYRTYDWGRVDSATGRPRELHLDRAMECINFDTPSPPPMQNQPRYSGKWTEIISLVACESFLIEQVCMTAGAELDIPFTEPVAWIVLEGTGLIELGSPNQSFEFCKGNVVLLPAALSGARLKITSAAKWLEVAVPVPDAAAEFNHPRWE